MGPCWDQDPDKDRDYHRFIGLLFAQIADNSLGIAKFAGLPASLEGSNFFRCSFAPTQFNQP